MHALSRAAQREGLLLRARKRAYLPREAGLGLVDFKGKRYRAVENEYGKQVKQDEVVIRQSARYRFDGKEYVLVSGENAVPGL